LPRERAEIYPRGASVTRDGIVKPQKPTLGELLKHSRRTAGLTQEGLAARSGVSARVISDLERNVMHVPRSATVQLLVAALSLSDAERELFENAAIMDRTAAAPDRRSEVADLPPLIDRSTELTVIERHLSGQSPPLLLLAGEPGIGKTRLLQEASGLASARGLHVLHGSVQRLDHDGLRDPIVDALRRSIQSRSPVDLRRELQGCAWLVRLLPELAPGPIQPLPAVTIHAEQELDLVVRAVARFLENVAGPAGTLLTLDNLQHADAAALALLSKLVRSTPDKPLRIVAAYRDDEDRRPDALLSLLASLAHDQQMRQVTLPPLSLGAATDLLLACVKDYGGTATELLERVVHETGGVPFYLTAWAHDINTLRAASLDDHVPWPTRHSVRARIDSASAPVRPVLETVCAAGGRITFPVLVAVAGPPDTDVLAALESATRARLIQEDGETYMFAYEVIRRAIEADLSHTRRALLRRRLTALMPRRVHSINAQQVPSATRNKINEAAERAHHLAVLRRHRAAPPG
jgi:predicted ATPase